MFEGLFYTATANSEKIILNQVAKIKLCNKSVRFYYLRLYQGKEEIVEVIDQGSFDMNDVAELTFP